MKSLSFKCPSLIALLQRLGDSLVVAVVGPGRPHLRYRNVRLDFLVRQKTFQRLHRHLHVRALTSYYACEMQVIHRSIAACPCSSNVFVTLFLSLLLLTSSASRSTTDVVGY